MILGFTGTRAGLTPALPGLIAALPDRVLHGGAEGADTEFDVLLVAAGMPLERIEVYPTSEYRARLWLPKEPGPSRVVHLPQVPLDRNRVIAQRCDWLLACPMTAVEIIRSGTWATVRYARKAGKPITLALLNGKITEEG